MARYGSRNKRRQKICLKRRVEMLNRSILLRYRVVPIDSVAYWWMGPPRNADCLPSPSIKVQAAKTVE